MLGRVLTPVLLAGALLLVASTPAFAARMGGGGGHMSGHMNNP